MPPSVLSTPRQKKETKNPSLAPFSGSDTSRILKQEYYGRDDSPSPPPTKPPRQRYRVTPPEARDVKPSHSDSESDFGHTPTKKKRKDSSDSVHNPRRGGNPLGRPRGRGAAWSAEEDWVMFQLLHPKVIPNWAEIAGRVGRDVKNRYSVVSKRLEFAIKSIGRT